MKQVLAINGGSSSIKFALFDAATNQRVLGGKIDRIGFGGTTFSYHDSTNGEKETVSLVTSSDSDSADYLIDWIKAHIARDSIEGIGHRLVHGGEKLHAPQLIDDDVLSELKRITPYDPDHLPAEIRLIESFRAHFGKVPQVACFDTAFHANMPVVAKLLAIPRRYQTKGIRRYGFHGLSYAFLMQELARLAGAKVANGRVILAHLGSGASMAAVRDGQSMDTTMAFTPAAGLMMSSRSGDIDPGLVSFLSRSEGMTAAQFDHMVNHESGLLGVSETSSDMRDLLAREKEDFRAGEAVSLFCYQAKKWIGAYTAVLGGLDTLVFAGGVGENAPEIRARICAGLEFLGTNLDNSRNKETADIISAETSKVTVRVIRTDEELMIARSVSDLLGLAG
ncbi:MAG: acetate/propionate family kinase [Chthoniobacterales bacterium]|nr:acetate/propionate family kinase [Chthoniobacterales bacterium]